MPSIGGGKLQPCLVVGSKTNFRATVAGEGRCLVATGGGGTETAPLIGPSCVDCKTES